MEISRRRFLEMLGVVAGGMALTSCGVDPRWSVPDELVKLAQRGPGIETWGNTLCGQCGGGCGIKIRFIDGIPVKIEGNPMFPINRGGMCPQGAAGLDTLYHPDRIKAPLLRSGNRGSGSWKPISWDEALEMVITRLSKLRSEENTHKVAVLKEDSSILMDDIFSMFLNAYGSPNLIDASDKEGQYLAYHIMQGRGIVGYDFGGAKYVLNFGANLFEEGPSPVRYMQAYKELREQKGERAKIVHISPRLSTTGLKASEWLPIKPGTYGVLALGIAHILIKENLYDNEFVTQRTTGFNEWKTYVLKEFYPNRTSNITGIPVEQIIRISREFGYTRPALSIGNHNTTASSNGLFNMLAVHSLNALAGGFEKPGGVVIPDEIPLRELPAIETDSIAKSGLTKPSLDEHQKHPVGLKSVNRLLESILSDKPYSLDTLFIYNSNPLFTYPHQEKFKKAMEKIPFIVSFSNFIDETAEYADIILPDHSFLEKWDLNQTVPTVNFAFIGIQKPVVVPFHDSRHSGDTMLTIASHIKGMSLPFKDSLELLKYRVEGIFRRGSGLVISEKFEESWWDFLRKRGWYGLRHTNYEEFWKTMIETGGWWEPLHKYGDWERIFKNSDGRFKFVYTLKEQDILSSYTSPESNAKDTFPFYLNTFNMLTNQKGKGANSPLLQEMFGFYHQQHWKSWIEINPELAEKLHLHDGDIAEVESSEGKIRLTVKIYAGTRHDVVNIPFGQGHTSYGRYAKGIGVNPHTIMVKDIDSLSDIPSLSSTRVRISKV
ncbi:MAG: molybdopterin-dependent oxidoreductase [Nitrospirota bacterium]